MASVSRLARWLSIVTLTLASVSSVNAQYNATLNHFTTEDGTGYAYEHVRAPCNAPTVLLIHGYPSTHNDWRHQIKDLAAAGYGVIAPDGLGYGESDHPTEIEAYNYRRLAGHIDELLNDAGVPEVVGVGHDWGSWVLSRTFNFHADRFSKLVFASVGYGPAGTGLDLDGANAQGLAAAGYTPFGYMYFFNTYDAHEVIGENIESFFHLLYPENNTVWETDLAPIAAARAWLNEGTTTDLPPWLTEEDKAQWIASHSQQDVAEAALNYYKVLMQGTFRAGEEDITQEQVVISVPVLGIGGSEDVVTQPEILKASTEPYAAAGFQEVILEAGHWPQLEQSQAFSEALIEFIQS